MTSRLTPIERCAAIAGLSGHEIVLGVSPGAKHERMLARYRRAASRDTARTRLVADIRSALQLGAPRRAADLLVVLRRLLAEGSDLSAVTAFRRARPRRDAPMRFLSCAKSRDPAPESGTILPWRKSAATPLSESVV